MSKPHDICPSCNAREMMYFPIEEANVPDGDGVANYYTVDYWHCMNCDKYFDEDMEECEKPEQQSLI